ncbi:hypothetical protein Tco_0195818 [Tanacetum coccineum]
MSSPNHDDLAHLKIPLENILEATNNFGEEKNLYKGEFENIDEGQLFDAHKNRVSLVGFVMKDDERSTLSSLENRTLELPAEVEVMSYPTNQGSLTSISSHVDSHVSKETKSFLKDLSHLKLSYQDIASATNNFDEENIINIDEMLFKGRLWHSKQFIDIFGKAYRSDSEKDESKMFWMELSMLSSLKHK